jgi:hypothetical protein
MARPAANRSFSAWSEALSREGDTMPLWQQMPARLIMTGIFPEGGSVTGRKGCELPLFIWQATQGPLLPVPL